ncbi:hypothetical protein [Escherichia phage vB_EcoP_PHB19]|uniref:Uncharacterized protein n=1 Tax=Escherichia phage vB_EcoP_PHB19 TaxID=2698729 RepID=A0A6B9RNQ2_9CAUD|nr:hypothetical protein [Escherichia phage vB_EcoP_PHB19]
MRDPKIIQAEIAKLEAELEDVKCHEAKTRSAVHILKNLGWTWTRQTGWKKPESYKLSHKVFDKDTMTHIKAGDWVKVDTGVVGGYGYVRSVRGHLAQVSFIERIVFDCVIAQESSKMYQADQLRVVPYNEIVRAFTGK